jgi:hypothetical protein
MAARLGSGACGAWAAQNSTAQLMHDTVPHSTAHHTAAVRALTHFVMESSCSVAGCMCAVPPSFSSGGQACSQSPAPHTCSSSMRMSSCPPCIPPGPARAYLTQVYDMISPAQS